MRVLYVSQLGKKLYILKARHRDEYKIKESEDHKSLADRAKLDHHLQSNKMENRNRHKRRDYIFDKTQIQRKIEISDKAQRFFISHSIRFLSI